MVVEKAVRDGVGVVDRGARVARREEQVHRRRRAVGVVARALHAVGTDVAHEAQRQSLGEPRVTAPERAALDVSSGCCRARDAASSGCRSTPAIRGTRPRRRRTGRSAYRRTRDPAADRHSSRARCSCCDRYGTDSRCSARRRCSRSCPRRRCRHLDADAHVLPGQTDVDRVEDHRARGDRDLTGAVPSWPPICIVCEPLRPPAPGGLEIRMLPKGVLLSWSEILLSLATDRARTRDRRRGRGRRRGAARGRRSGGRRRRGARRRR